MDTDYKQHQIRTIKVSIKKFTDCDFEESWNRFFDKNNYKTIRELKTFVDQSFNQNLKFKKVWTPLHVSNHLFRIGDVAVNVLSTWRLCDINRYLLVLVLVLGWSTRSSTSSISISSTSSTGANRFAGVGR